MPITPSNLRTTRLWRELHARLAQPRRLIVAALVGVAAICGIDAARPPSVASRQVWVAARDLSGGQPLGPTDLRLERMPAIEVPSGALPPGGSLTGRLLAAPVRRGEPITDVRLLSPTLLSALDQPGLVAVPVRVADGPATLAVVRAGDRVNVIAASDPSTGEESTGAAVVHDVRVLAIPSQMDPSAIDAGDGDGGSGSGSGSGSVLIVAATPHQAAALAQAAATSRLSVAVRRPA
jgi:Flp pilus assembly protein CpaB